MKDYGEAPFGHGIELTKQVARFGLGYIKLTSSVLCPQSHPSPPIPSRMATTAPAMAAAARPVADAVELIRACPEHPWTVGQLASRVSVSVRALQAGFRRSLGTPPMTYLRLTRLDRVHDQLKAAPRGSVAVGAVAAHWGFTHMGRFAAEYRYRFGERPSDTLEQG